MNTAEWQEVLSQACYRHVLPHLDEFQDEEYLDESLHLMEPRIFAAFAMQACRDVADLVVGALREHYERQTSGIVTVPAALRELSVEAGDEAKLCAELALRVADFGDALERYRPSYERFQQALGQVDEATMNTGASYGLVAGRLVGNVFGEVAGIVAGLASGYLGGRAVDQEMQAEADRLQKAFQVMLGAYDRAMNTLINTAFHVLVEHRKAVVAACRGCR